MKETSSITERTWRTFKRDYRLVSRNNSGISVGARIALVDYYGFHLKVASWTALLTSGNPFRGDQLTELPAYGQRRTIAGPDQRLP